MTETATSISTWSPKYPEILAALSTIDGGLYDARVLWQEESYGYYYDLYVVTGGNADKDGWPPWHFIVVPFGQLFISWLGPDVNTIIANFRYICERVTMQQLGWADQGKLSCPAQSMKDFLMKHRVFHCDGQFRGGKLTWPDRWRGNNRYPVFPISQRVT